MFDICLLCNWWLIKGVFNVLLLIVLKYKIDGCPKCPLKF